MVTVEVVGVICFFFSFLKFLFYFWPYFKYYLISLIVKSHSCNSWIATRAETGYLLRMAPFEHSDTSILSSCQICIIRGKKKLQIYFKNLWQIYFLIQCENMEEIPKKWVTVNLDEFTFVWNFTWILSILKTDNCIRLSSENISSHKTTEAIESDLYKLYFLLKLSQLCFNNL